jgi:hypothetical protein
MKHGYCVLLLLSFFVYCIPGRATTYYFSTSGSDANNGLSTSKPKQSIAAANLLMQGGNIILFKRGDTWYIPRKGIVLDNRSNCTLDAYGTGNRPVIAGMDVIKGPWKYEGNYVWSSATGYGEALRVFVNGVSRISLNDKAGNNPVLSDLNTTDEYLFNKTTGRLYIRHTSSTAAPVNVLIVPGFPAPPIISMLNTRNVNIRNIDFRGGGNVSVIRIYAPSANILIDNCMITHAKAIGIFAINTKQNMNVVENLVIQNCILDKTWTLAENNLKSSLTLEGDGIAFMHGVKSSVVRNCKITNWGHNGISVLASLFTTGIYGVKYNKFEGNDISAGNSGYMHAIGVQGFKNLAMYNIFKRNYCHGFSAANTIGGSNNFVFGNIFENVKVSKLPQHSHVPHAISLSTWTYKDSRGVSGSFECKNNWVVNNTMYNTDTYAVLVDRSNTNGDQTTLLDNKIYNNLMLNFGMDTTYKWEKENGGAPLRLGLRVLMNVTPKRTYIKNNNFWVTWNPSTTRAVAMYTTTWGSYNASQLNNCKDCGSGMVTGNTQMDPKLGTFYRLTSSSSALLRTGGYSCKSSIVAAGLPAAEFVDYYGKPWPNPGTSVGAIQY